MLSAQNEPREVITVDRTSEQHETMFFSNGRIKPKEFARSLFGPFRPFRPIPDFKVGSARLKVVSVFDFWAQLVTTHVKARIIHVGLGFIAWAGFLKNGSHAIVRSISAADK